MPEPVDFPLFPSSPDSHWSSSEQEDGKAHEDLPAQLGASEHTGSQQDLKSLHRTWLPCETTGLLNMHPEEQESHCWCWTGVTSSCSTSREHQRPLNLRLPAPSPGRARQQGRGGRSPGRGAPPAAQGRISKAELF